MFTGSTDTADVHIQGSMTAVEGTAAWLKYTMEHDKDTVNSEQKE